MNFQIAGEHKFPSAREPSSRFNSLEAIDWNFPGRVRKNGLEAIHPYPAKFIPDLPGTILDLLPVEPGTIVLDPFVGSGTTLVECQRRGISSAGVDLNPIACLISRVKTRPLPKDLDHAIAHLLNEAKNSRRTKIPPIPNLDHWFEGHVQIALVRILASIEASPAQFQDVFRLALSSIMVRVSNQDSDTRYAAVDKKIGHDQVASLFAQACERINISLQERDYVLLPTQVLQSDTLRVRASDFKHKVGAVITSPPYPNAYEYWLYHKYRMWWLGYDPLSVKEQEIGARAHFFKTNHHTADNFIQQMRGTFKLISSVLTLNGYACFVVGRSKIHGKIIDNARLIETVAREFGFYLTFRTERVIAANRKSFNLSHAAIKTESVIVFARANA
ncbi:MAG: DNA methyltransferase [bacterium]|nr:DNA methyltransferase [bacterium]